jgi:hypothetical protein
MSKKLIVLLAVIAVLIISVSVVGAQGNGNRNGGCNLQQTNCPNAPQGNRGRMGMGNAQTNANSNGRGRGQMGQGAGPNNMNSFVNLPPASVTELPQDVIDLMISGWTDEQHAYVMYQSVINQFGNVRPFTNIQRAEAQHIAAWEFLFARYGIPVPEIPTFEVPTFASITEACQLGAQAEVANFDLYDMMLTTFDPYADIHQVAQNLRNASELNHLSAFQQCGG